MQSLYSSVPLARAMLRGDFSDSAPAPSNAPPLLYHPFPFQLPFPTPAPSYPAPKPRPPPQRRYSTASTSSEQGSVSSYPGVPLDEWLASEDMREEQETTPSSAEEMDSALLDFDEESDMEDDGEVDVSDDDDYQESTRKDTRKHRRTRPVEPIRDSRSPGTPTVDDALKYFQYQAAPYSGPTITLSATSLATYNIADASAARDDTPSLSASGHIYTPPAAKPFKCPTPGCSKSYKQFNGLKYHQLHGKCSVVLGADGEVELGAGGEPREPWRRYGCMLAECGKRYKNMNGLRYHYQHSGQHGVIGLELLKQRHHPLFPTLRQMKGLDPPPVAPVHSPTEIVVGDAATPQEESGIREVPAEEEAPKLTEPTMPAMRMQPL